MTVLTYYGTGPWGAGKGSTLTAVEGDGNIYNLDRRIYALETTPPTAISISNVTQSGSNLYVHLTDSTILGPFPMPGLTLTFKGVWAPLTVYALNQMITANGGIYAITYPHTSSSGSFDPGANDGLGHNYYGLLLAFPDNVLPFGGATGDVLGKNSGTDFDVTWITPHYVHSGGATGTFLTKLSGTTGDEDWVAATLNSLTGVDVSGAVIGDFLAFDGYTWLPHLPVFADLTDTASPTQVRQSTITPLATTGTVSLDPTLGNIFTLTPTGAVTLNAASAPTDADITVIITTSGTSSYNVTPTTNFKSIGLLATGVLSGKVYTLTFRGDGTNLNELSRTIAM